MARWGAVAVAVLLSLTGCGGTGHDHGAMTNDKPADHDPAAHDDTSAFGVAGDPAEADRTIEVEATDELAFEPESIEVEAGETVTFVVTNAGKLPHEFVLGDAEYQEMHEEEMSSGGGHGSSGISIAPGSTAEITWTFTEAGSFEFACHVEGHYPGGMRGTIQVS